MDEHLKQFSPSAPWYPYLKYQAECKEDGKEDTVQEWLEITGKVEKPKPKPKPQTKSKSAPKKISNPSSKTTKVKKPIKAKIQDAFFPNK